MGTNYYLYKKDNTDWILPKDSTTEKLLMKYVLSEAMSGKEDTSLVVKAVVKKEKGLHIGKSSLGWHFDLCIYSFLDIYDLNDWMKFFKSDKYIIKDENDKEILADKMLDIITNRKAKNFENYKTIKEYEKHVLLAHNEFEKNFGSTLNTNGAPKHYNSYEEILAENHAERGLNGLWAHKTSLTDLRLMKGFENFLPVLSIHYRTNGTYDLTPNWDFD